MMRTQGLVVSIALAIGFATACDVGEVPGPGGGPDGAIPGSPDAVPVAQLACQPPSTPPGSGNHEAGNACLQGGCHAVGGDGPTWTVAGTLYTTAAGIAPNPNGTVTVQDAIGRIIQMPANANGNFYTNQTVTMPLKTISSSCPTVMPMIALSANGNCNAAGCHSGGAARIYLTP